MKFDIKKVAAVLLVVNLILVLVLEPMIGLIIFVVAAAVGGYFYFKKRRLNEKNQSKNEVKRYIKEIENTRSVPIVVDTGLDTEQEESVFLYEKVLFLNIETKGFYPHHRKDEPKKHPRYPGFTESDRGTVALTSTRIIFRGNDLSMDLPLSVPVELYSQSGLLFISSGSAPGNTIVFNVKNPDIWRIASDIVRTVQDPINMSLQDLAVLEREKEFLDT